MDAQDNPILASRHPGYADHGPTQPSISSEPPAPPKRPKVPAAIGRIVGELGLRYRPSAQADLEGHAETLRLLAEDLADIPPHLLEAAAKRWVRERQFMPKASELIALARGQLQESRVGTDAGLRQLEAHCDALNRMAWVRESGKPYFVGERRQGEQVVRIVDRAA